MRNSFVAFFLFFLLFTSCMPACPIQSCHVRKQHAHGKKNFRGQPIWKKQNPKIGEKMPKKPYQDNPESRRKEQKKKK
jgi:hypothetical protein